MFRGENHNPFWSFCLARAKEVHLVSKIEGPRKTWLNMSMVLGTKKSNFVSQ